MAGSRTTSAQGPGRRRAETPTASGRRTGGLALTITGIGLVAVLAKRGPDAEGDDQDEPERDPVQRDGGEQDDERRGTGEEAARDADGEQRAHGQAVGDVVRVTVMVFVIVV